MPVALGGLRFIGTPSGVVAGRPFDVSIAVEDGAGHPSSYAGDVVIEILAGSSPPRLAGTTRTAAFRGGAVFQGVLIDAPVAGASLRAVAAGLSATSDPFDVATPPVLVVEPPMGGDPKHGWQRIGFPGGAVWAVTSIPGVGGAAFAATPRGIFSTRNGAQSWSSCTMAGAPSEAATALLAVSATELWADFNTLGFWLSNDGCATWVEKNEGLEKSPSFGGYEPSRLELHGGQAYVSSWHQTLHRNNATNMWERLADPAPRDPMIGFAAAPSDPQIAYAFSYGETLYASSDRGASWQVRASASFKGYGGTGAIAVHPTRPEVALVVDGRIYRTEDGGKTLMAVSDFSVLRVFFDPVNGDVAYATRSDGGILRSRDSGRTWAFSNEGLPFFGLAIGLIGNWTSFLALDGADPTFLYAGFTDGEYGSGVYRSVSGGTSWERAVVGLDAGGVTAVASDAAVAALYAGAADGVYKSSDGGASWTFLASLPLVLSISVDPGDHNVLLAGTMGGIYRSGDGGASWTVPALPWPSAIGTVWHHPTERGLALAATQGILRSTDGGLTWSRMSTDATVLGFAVDADSGHLFASALPLSRDPGGFFVSSDEGMTWTRTSAASGSLFSDNGPAPALYLLPRWNGLLQQSLDRGTTWNSILTLPFLAAIAVADTQTIYAARTATCAGISPLSTGCMRSGGIVLRSNDRGATWSSTQDAFSLEMIKAVWASPLDSSQVLVGTLDGGLYRSVSGGR